MTTKTDETTWTTAIISLFIFFALVFVVYFYFSNPEIDARATAYNQCMSNEKMRNTAAFAAQMNGHKGDLFAHAYLKSMCERETSK
jgi:hypothetical protein